MPKSSTPNSRAAARKLVSSKTKLGLPRKIASENYSFSSESGAHNASDVLSLYLAWREFNGLKPGNAARKAEIEAYLSEVAESYEQKTLNSHRSALEKIYQVAGISHFKSLLITEEGARDYYFTEIQAITQHQKHWNSLCSLIAYASGMRAHEFCTLKPIAEQPPSAHRKWRKDLFAGMHDYSIYTVQGKGGLCRAVAIPNELVEILESYRLTTPRRVRDRKIDYTMYYDIGYGQAFSQSFQYASEKALGWSTGAHGMRHSFAKRRFAELRKLSYTHQDAQLIVSQLLGHFRPSITMAYFR